MPRPDNGLVRQGHQPFDGFEHDAQGSAGQVGPADGAGKETVAHEGVARGDEHAFDLPPGADKGQKMPSARLPDAIKERRLVSKKGKQGGFRNEQ